MSQLPLPPHPPTGNSTFDRWLILLRKRINSAGQILWAYLDFSGSNLTDLETRNHNDLQTLQGGTAGEYYHLTKVERERALAAYPFSFPEEFDEPLFVPHQATDLSMFNVESGFVDSTASTLSFVDGTRTFTITPVGTMFEGYSYGQRFAKSAADSLVISNDEGLHFIYYDATGTLQEQLSVTDDLITSKCLITLIYWDATNAEHLLLGNERHGRTMDSRTHLYLHHTRGTVYESGLGLSGIVADGSGNAAASAQFQVASGIIWDEDIKLTITDGLTQTLSPIAQIPVYYKTGASGAWRRLAATNFPLAYGNAGTRADWNEFTGGAWQFTQVGNLNFVLMHYFATSDTESNQIIGIVGQAEYSTQAQARAGALVELKQLVLAGLPSVEFVAIATVIWQTSNGYANTPKSRIRTTDTGDDYIDWRTFRLTASGSSGSGNEWGLITGTLSAQTDLQAALDKKAGKDQVGAYFTFNESEGNDFPIVPQQPAVAASTSDLDKWVLIFAAAHG
jgi:hypothetical protein